MTCEHPRKWEMEHVAYSDIRWSPYLREGWEPISVAGLRHEERVFLRRLKPCEECKKV